MFDLGYYDQVLWLAANGKSLFSTMVEAHTWTDHFSPSLFLLIPFYLIKASPLVLLFVQALLLSLGAIPLYYLALKKTENVLFSYAVAIAYLMFWGIHNAIAYDFHPLALGAPLFAFMIYFYEKQKWLLFWVTTTIFGGLQENYLIFLCVFGIFLLLRYHDALQGLLLTMLSGVLFFMLIFIVIPRTFQMDYGYLPQGENSSITTFFEKAYLPTEKVTLLGYSFGAFSFLPLLSPTYLLLFAEEYAGRFLVGSNPNWWSFGYQYNALPAALLALSAIEVVSKFKKGASVAAVFILLCTAVTFVRVNPDTLRAFDTNFYNLSHTADAYAVINMVPEEKSLAAANNLGAHLSQREEIYFITNCLEENAETRTSDGKKCSKVMPDYLIADLGVESNWNNFVYNYNRDEVNNIFMQKIMDGSYEMFAQKGNIYLLHKVSEANK